jgi:DNA-binding response OmpR family regulator
MVAGGRFHSWLAMGKLVIGGSVGAFPNDAITTPLESSNACKQGASAGPEHYSLHMPAAGDGTGRTRSVAPARILIVEDEPGIVDFLERGLRAEGYAVEAATDGAEGEKRALEESFDVLVLDLMLPERTGLQVLASLRESRPLLPVIVLTALGEVEDRVAGLDAGAADYLVKPFELPELTARIRAQLRLANQTPAATLRAADIELDLLTRRVRRGGQEIHLSSTEFKLLAHLLRHRGQALSRKQILGAVWGYDHDPATNVVDVYVTYLRRKLRVGDRPAPISTVRAVGYRLDDATGS